MPQSSGKGNTEQQTTVLRATTSKPSSFHHMRRESSAGLISLTKNLPLPKLQSSQTPTSRSQKGPRTGMGSESPLSSLRDDLACGEDFPDQLWTTTVPARVLRAASTDVPLGKSVSARQSPTLCVHQAQIIAFLSRKGCGEGSPVMSLSSEAQPPELQAWREAWTVPAVPREQEMAGQ